MTCKGLAAAKTQFQVAEDAWMQLAAGNVERYTDLLSHARGSPAFELKKQEYLGVISSFRGILSHGR